MQPLLVLVRSPLFEFGTNQFEFKLVCLKYRQVAREVNRRLYNIFQVRRFVPRLLQEPT